MQQIICDAIANKAVIQFQYHGYLRIVEPHTCGTDSKGDWALSAYQRQGKPNDLPDWRFYHLSDMRSLSAAGLSFAAPRDGYKRGDTRFVTIRCQL